MKLFFTTLLLIMISSFAQAQIACNSWVKLNNRFAAVTVGDLDVTGDQITVEALFVLTGPTVDIISKHLGGSDLNYLLRAGRGEISTTISGFTTTDQGTSPCNDVLELNKIYHAALVYNGSTLKFYRNGALISSVPCFGDLLTNDWNTAIGEHAPVVTPAVNGIPNPDYHNQNEGQGYYDESFRGFINEVKIWKVARTQEQLQQYMFAPLPDPSTQVGLLGYWTMDGLQNKQGNAAYNGTIEGAATINETSSICSFVRDSCNVLLPVKITSFNAYEEDKGEVKLTWQTDEEVNINSYVVLRSATPGFTNYTEAGTVIANGTGRTNSYSFTDGNVPGNKTWYYRLLIREISGAYSYTVTRSVKINSGPAFTADVYPNPTSDGSIKVKLSELAADAEIRVYNSFGQLLTSKKANRAAGNIFTIEMAGYSKGSYLINIFTGEKRIIKKITKL